jgi:hypothetical protein
VVEFLSTQNYYSQDPDSRSIRLVRWYCFLFNLLFKLTSNIFNMKIKIILVAIQAIIAVGAFAQSNTNLGTSAGNSGSDNTSIGYSAGDVVTGTCNTFVGSSSALAVSSGLRNTFVGFASGRFTTTANYNVFLGADCGYKNITGAQNVFLGSSAGYQNISGQNNVFIGESSGSSNVSGTRNTFAGQGSGLGSTGSDNTIYGYLGGRNITAGNQNTVVGSSAGYNIGSGIGNVFLGYNAGYNEAGSNKLYIDNSATSTPLIFGDFSGRQVGINSLPSPTYTLTVGGAINATGVFVNGTAIGTTLWTNSGTNSYYNGSGNVGIGSQNPDYKLTVNGTIHSKEIKVDVNLPPDYVFDTNYSFPTLDEVQTYISKNHHLPEVPAAAEMEKNGVQLGEMNMLLLKKIEEMTLYMIEMKKENDALKSRVQSLENKR